MLEKKDTEDGKEWQNRFLLFLGIIAMAVSMLVYGVFGGHFRQAYQTGIFACVLLIFLWLILRNVSFAPGKDKLFLPVVLIIFGLTLAVVLCSVYVDTCLLWMGGSILLAACFPAGVGIGFFLCFGCLFCFTNSVQVSYAVFMFLIGVVFCSSVSWMKREKAVSVVVLADLIFYILLFFVVTKGSGDFFRAKTVVSMAGLAGFLLGANFLYRRMGSKE